MACGMVNSLLSCAPGSKRWSAASPNLVFSDKLYSHPNLGWSKKILICIRVRFQRDLNECACVCVCVSVCVGVSIMLVYSYIYIYSFIVKDLCFCLLYNQVVNNHSFSICLKMFLSSFPLLACAFIIALSRCSPLYFSFLSFFFLAEKVFEFSVL